MSKTYATPREAITRSLSHSETTRFVGNPDQLRCEAEEAGYATDAVEFFKREGDRFVEIVEVTGWNDHGQQFTVEVERDDAVFGPAIVLTDESYDADLSTLEPRDARTGALL